VFPYPDALRFRHRLGTAGADAGMQPARAS